MKNKMEKKQLMIDFHELGSTAIKRSGAKCFGKDADACELERKYLGILGLKNIGIFEVPNSVWKVKRQIYRSWKKGFVETDLKRIDKALRGDY